MRRLTSTLLAALLLLVCGLDSAGAHGGQYRGPNDEVPPGRREPADATPPYPPPPRRGRLPGPPVEPQPAGGGSPTPQSRPPSRGFEEWVFWWHHNTLALNALKFRLYRRAPDAMRLRAQKEIIPAFLRVIATEQIHQDIRAAAYIGLAKLTKDPAHIALLKKGLDKKQKQDLIVLEAAAIGLGLLRRADAVNQFQAETLDHVRDFLFQVFEDEDYQARTRGFAALAIGLLGDQPTAGASKGAAATTARLFTLLRWSYAWPDLPIALLMAVGLQPAASVTEAQREVLRSCISKGRLGTHEVGAFVRSFAPLALGRIGVAKDVVALGRGLASTRTQDRNLRRACAIGLGQLGRWLPAEDRVVCANVLIRSLTTLADPSAIRFSIISLAQLILADVACDKADLFTSTMAGSVLLAIAESAPPERRAFGALALGLIVREIGDESVVEVHGAYRARSLRILRKGLTATQLEPRARSAFAVALGLARDLSSVGTLVELTADRKESPELRSYAALGLGFIGCASRDVTHPVREALQESHSELLPLQAATALGLLRDSEGEARLLASLKQLQGSRRDTHGRGQLLLALSRVGTEQTVTPLLALLKDEEEHDYVRALACAGLGVIADLERHPSLWRLTRNLNYRAQPDLVSELLSLL